MGDHPLAGFAGYRMPGYTQIPDQLLDEQLHLLSHAELKVLLYIMRHTFGYKRDGDHLSARQIAEGIVRRDGTRVDSGTGCEIATVRRTVKRLEELGLITVRREQPEHDRAEVNFYTVRIADGGGVGVAATPRGCSPDTQGVVSPRHPQETIRSQETERQQQRGAKPGDPAGERGLPAARRTAVVVASHADDQANSEALALADRLAALGVARSTAGKLLREHGPEVVGRWLAYTEHRLREGWLPNETPAAWLVSAIRAGDWIIPDWFATPEEQAAAEVADREAKQELARRQEEAEAREREEAAAQRLAFEERLGVDDEARRLWQGTRELLDARGEGSIALATAYLLPVTSDVATLATTVAFFCDRLADRAETIRAALEEASGRPVREVKIELVKPEVKP